MDARRAFKRTEMDHTALHALVFDAIGDPILVVDESGDIIVANAAALAFFDLGERRSTGQLAAAEGDLAVDAAELARLVARHGSVRDYVLLDGQGRESGYSLDVQRIRVPGAGYYCLTHVRDRTPERDRDLWKDEIIAMVSHEIKNPLAAMKNSVEILRSQVAGELTEGQCRFLDTSERSIDRLTRLLDGFLDVSRIRAGAFDVHRAHHDVRDFVDEVLGSFASLYNVQRVTLDWSVDESLSEAWFDAGKLEQILVNLLSNALKFTPEGGSIRVTVGQAGIEAMGEDLRLLPWGEIEHPRMIEINVSDTGLGMESETLEQLFERHGPARGNGSDSPTHGAGSRGSHLGLSISRALVEAQGGWLNIESRLGLGTTVRVFLPQDRRTSATLARVGRLAQTFARLATARRPVGLYVLGKYNDDNWEDIARSWLRPPAVNPPRRETATDSFTMWTLSTELAVCAAADLRADDTVASVFSPRFVECEQGAHVFGSYAVGACRAPDEARTFAQCMGVATSRMARAREAMARATIEKMDSGIECLTNEWGVEQ